MFWPSTGLVESHLLVTSVSVYLYLCFYLYLCICICIYICICIFAWKLSSSYHRVLTKHWAGGITSAGDQFICVFVFVSVYLYLYLCICVIVYFVFLPKVCLKSIFIKSLCFDQAVGWWNHICWWPVVTNHKPTGRRSPHLVLTKHKKYSFSMETNIFKQIKKYFSHLLLTKHKKYSFSMETNILSQWRKIFFLNWHKYFQAD